MADKYVSIASVGRAAGLGFLLAQHASGGYVASLAVKP